jgi:MFS family permease
LKGTFRLLQNFNYRIWAIGALVSNIGSWMQRTAQDWNVLTELTHRNATAVGIVMGLQFGPQLLLLPLSGFAADHLDRRKILFYRQAAMGLLALGLGLLTVTGVVRLWHVYVFAFLLGCASAFDSPARQTFVAELVEERDLPNAVALNSTSFNAARMIGPAIAGGLIAGVGQFGLLTSMMAAGSVTGALMAAARARPTIAVLLAGAATFGAGCALAALMPSYALFGLALFVVGVAAQSLTTSTNSLVQLSTEPGIRGRMIAILLAITLGGTPIGAPIVGWVADTFGPRRALGVGAAAGLLAAAAGLAYLVKGRQPVADASLGQG